MNPDIVADILEDGWINYLNFINKDYDFVEPEGLPFTILYNCKLIKNIEKILSKEGKFIIYRHDALAFFLLKFYEKFPKIKPKQFFPNTLTTKKINELIHVIENKEQYKNIAKKLQQIIKSWEKKYGIIFKKSEHVLFHNLLITRVTRFLIENSKLCLGIPIQYKDKNKYNFEESREYKLLQNIANQSLSN